jgi:hypothetical protein
MLPPAMGPDRSREDLEGTEGDGVMDIGGGDMGESVVARMTLARGTYSFGDVSLNLPNL